MNPTNPNDPTHLADRATPQTTDTPAATPATSTLNTAPAAQTTMSPSHLPPVTGWSVKQKVMGHDVHNEHNEKIGDIRDLIMTADGQISHYIIGVGGFLGLGEHDVAIAFQEIQHGEGTCLLRGYTKERLKELPQADINPHY